MDANQQIENLTLLITQLTTNFQQLQATVNGLTTQQNQQTEAQQAIMEIQPPQVQPAGAENTLNPNNINATKAKAFASMQMNNPRVSQRIRTQAFDTLAFLESVPPEAMEQPTIAKFVNSKLMVDSATLLSGPRLGGWVRDSLLSQEIGLPAPKQPEYQPQGQENPQRKNKRGGNRSRGRGGSSK